MENERLKLTLFVRYGESGKALFQLYKALEFHAYTDYELNIADIDSQPPTVQSIVVKHPPTLVRHTEQGDLYYGGDFSETEKIRRIFGFLTS